jgi:hypothetical protein
MHGPSVPGFLIHFILLALFVTFVGGALAAPPPPSADAHACAVRTGGFLDGSLAFWQQRLNLADWKVSIVISHASDLKPKTLGNIHWDSKKKTAIIHVLDTSDYQVSCGDALPDMEMTLVHELIHLELSALPRSPASRHEEELAVNRIADALVRLDRQEERSAALGAKPDAPRSREDAPAGDIVSR